MTSRLALLLVIALVLVGSCSLPRPSVDLTINSTSIAGSREGSFCQSGGCSAMCGDAPPLSAPLTRVMAGAPYVFEFSTGAEVNRIHVDLFPGDGLQGQSTAYTFDLSGTERRHSTTTPLAGHYYIVVTIGWSRFTDRGDTSRMFQVDIAPK